MTKELFTQYASLKAQIKALEDAAKEVNAKIVEEMTAEDIDKVESDFGVFFFKSLKNIKYSEAIKPFEEAADAAKKALAEAQAKEVAEGKAEVTVTKSLNFTPKKDG